jgi:glucosamine--fructose-6-phosphate aminotransferase (isomerizing)
MIKEILEEPLVIKRTILEEQENIRRIANKIKTEDYKMAYITGSGTSYHAGLVGQYILSNLTSLTANTILASEFQHWIPSNLSRKTLLIAISQSGESRDVIEATKFALKKGIDILAITSTPESTLARLASYIIFPRSGREVAVPATKTYVAHLTAVFMLATELAALEETTTNVKVLKERLYDMPNVVEEIFRREKEEVYKAAKRYCNKNLIFVLGSGPNYATALEAALKLKETCMVFAEGFAAREFLHGPIRLIDERALMILISPSDEVSNYVSLARSFKGFGADVLSILEETEDSKILAELSDSVFYVPYGLPKFFSPIVFIVPIQLFAYYMSVLKGLNPDNPEKLVKVVK